MVAAMALNSRAPSKCMGMPWVDSHCSNPFNRREGINRSAAAVMGVLQTDQRRLNRVRFFGADGRLNLFG